MSGRETPESVAHEEARLLLPWLANGSLSETETRQVARHVEECAVCREELDAERRLAELVRGAAAVAPAPHPVQLARLWERIDGAAPPAAAARRAKPPLAPLSRRWRWLVTAQAAAILLLGVLLLAPRPSPEPVPTFHTLAAPAAVGSPQRIRVVFVDTLDQRGLRDILLPLGAEIVAGPSPLGVYTIALPAERGAEPLAWVVTHLRSLPEVRFAEPIRDHGDS